MIKHKGNLCLIFSFIIGFFFFSGLSAAENPPVNGDFSTSSLCFSMDACSAYASLGTNFDYSEFTPAVSNSSSCLQMSVIGGSIYRDEPLRNPHSCTEGVNGTLGVCVSSVMDCNYPAGHMRSVKIDVQVVPGTDGTGSLSSLSFYEQAPLNYNWTNGPSGLNNYPTMYGVRVLKNGTEIYRSTDNLTTNNWTRESFSFLNESAFTVSETTVFSFELIGYCLVGNGSQVNAWDLDEIKIESSCGTVIDGGSLALTNGGTNTSACVGTGQGALIDVQLTGNQSPSGSYVITDADETIVAIPSAGPPFDLDGAGVGTCLIWYAAYNGNLTGFSVGSNAADIEGCFDLSNPVTVDRYTAASGNLSSPNGTEICANGDNMVELAVIGSIGSSRLIVTDLNGNLIGLPSSSPVDLSQYSGTQCIIRNIGYNGNLSGLSIGGNIANISGTCFEISNSITVSKMIVEGGVLSSSGATYINLCEGNGSNNLIDLNITNARGTNTQLVMTDSNGNIINMNPNLPFNFSGTSPGQYAFYNISWMDNLTGLTVGSNINALDGFCFSISNSVIVDKELAEGGTISSSLGSEFDICIEGNVSQPVDVSLTGSQGEYSRWIITDTNDNIIALPNNPPFVLDPNTGGTCVISHLSFESSFRGLFIGQNTANFQGCYDLSNSITVTKRRARAGSISSNGFSYIDICGAAGNEQVNITNSGGIAANSQYVVTDSNGNILAVSSGSSIDFGSYNNGRYTITNVAYNSGVIGLNVGGNINSITADCLDFSNPMIINKYSPVSGTITSSSGSIIDVCNDGQDDMIDVSVSGNSSGFQRWILTDANGNIIGLPNGAPFSFEGYPDGTCYLYSLSYENGIGGLMVGGNSNNFTGCYALSNSIQINKSTINAGSISLLNGTTAVSLCLEDNIPDVVTVNHTGLDASTGTYVITDSQGNILELADGPSFDFSGANTGTCRIYYVGYNDVTGLAPGNNINNITGCAAISNLITVYRNATEGGTLTTTDGFTEQSVCVSDGEADFIDVTLFGQNPGGNNQYVITDASGNILGLPTAPPFDFDGAGTGICFIWNINYSGNLTGLKLGENVSDLSGCYNLSNAVIVNRFDFDSAGSSSSLTYNMNSCSAITGSTQFDYSEMTPITENSPSCTQLTGSTIYRNDPVNFPHSCTPGMGGSAAICVSSLDNCDYQANSNYALRFDVTVAPVGNGNGGISTLSFMEAAPLNFTWLNGTSGPNNYPTRYGIRVMKNGTEIFRQVGLETSNAYTLENFDFSTNPAFNVNTTTVFSFELLGYCLAGVTGAPASAWDIDNLVVTTNCSGGLTGGDLALSSGGTSIEICADDGIDDNITVDLINAAGPNMSWVITDGAGNILGLPTAQPFNFEGAGSGTCYLWNLAYISGLKGLNVGANVSNLQGCYSLSNSISIERKTGAECTQPIIVIDGGVISTLEGLTQHHFCVDDGISDFVGFQVVNNSGSGSSWIITDVNQNIIAIPTSFPYDFEGTNLGRAFVYHIGYEGILENMDIGNSISMIEGEYEFSNAVVIDREECLEVAELIINDDYVTDVSLYPNPANNIITIKNNRPSKYGSEVVLYNGYGQTVGSYKVSNEGLQVDVSQYSEGFYYIKMLSGDNETSKSFTKM